jgi:glutamyl-tRNA synthetase
MGLMSIVTRFAPSPTGYLHIGGARTALFNYLYAKKMGGKFLLRIEDTDKERNTPEAVQAIYNGLSWLGLKHDGDVVLQSERADRHRQVAYNLLASGHAYCDYTTPEQMEVYRKDWSVSGKKGPFRYDSPYRDQQSNTPFIPDQAFTIRLKAPRDGSTTINDLVQGEVTVQNKELDDMILLRSDGTPTYMLAVVVDDYDMGVTHVIRGDDHLNNAFRQIPIYDGMGWTRPTYAHIPLIHDDQGKKLSKRTGAAAVEDYRDDLGILPEAMINYLARLGWGHGDDEIFSIDQAVDWFDIKDVKRNPARLDAKKLANINGYYIRNTHPAQLAILISPKLTSQGIIPHIGTLVGAMVTLRERSADLNALADGTMFLWAKRPIPIDEKANSRITDDTRKILSSLHKSLASSIWQEADQKFVIERTMEEFELKMGKVVEPLRIALTGSTVSPPIFDVMNLLGKDEALSRIKDLL